MRSKRTRLLLVRHLLVTVLTLWCLHALLLLYQLLLNKLSLLQKTIFRLTHHAIASRGLRPRRSLPFQAQTCRFHWCDKIWLLNPCAREGESWPYRNFLLSDIKPLRILRRWSWWDEVHGRWHFSKLNVLCLLHNWSRWILVRFLLNCWILETVTCKLDVVSRYVNYDESYVISAALVDCQFANFIANISKM